MNTRPRLGAGALAALAKIPAIFHRRRRDPHDRPLIARVLGRVERLEALTDELLRTLAELEVRRGQ